MRNKLEKPVLIFDGDCSFCRFWVDRARFLVRNQVEFRAYQEVASEFPEVPVSDFKKSVFYFNSDGTNTRAAEAVFQTLTHAPGFGFFLKAYQKVPGFAFVSEFLYRFIAAHRPFFFQMTTFFWGKAGAPSTFVFSSWIFRRGMAIVYFMAFGSLFFQIEGLLGTQGILPAQDFLKIVGERLGISRAWLIPTVFWWGATDAILKGVCVIGCVLALMIFFGFLPTLFFAINWVLYLSIVSVGGDFLRFQWDVLLLEAGFLTIFFSPLCWRENRFSGQASTVIRRLFYWLLFRLMFSSGLVKLLSGDVTWQRLTALEYHFETQPLPTWMGWHFHQLSSFFLYHAALFMFVIELAVPFLIFLPRRLRSWGAFILILFQVIIILTGNYGYFNWLTIVLCFLLVDDATWSFLFRWAGSKLKDENGNQKRWPRAIITPLSIFLFLLSAQVFSHQLFGWRAPRIVEEAIRPARSFFLANHYGLFSIMTTTRPEISIEGSKDGQNWFTYEFKYKPGSLEKRPAFVAPHQPRLDWQLWFVALGGYHRHPWFIQFCRRLLEGSPEVLGLLKKNPFPESPPQYIRAFVYNYKFTDKKTRRDSGQWWQRDAGQMFCPVLSLKDFRGS